MTMSWRTVKSYGYPYSEVYQDENLLEYGSVSKAKGATEYKAFYSNGHMKAGPVYRGRFEDARSWVEEMHAANPTPSVTL